MRERVSLYGGELVAGPQPGGGFRVTATLPLTPGTTTNPATNPIPITATTPSSSTTSAGGAPVTAHG
jgi:hypothetical protein